MQPPAAPAVLRRGSRIHRGGYSSRKKKTNAGIKKLLGEAATVQLHHERREIVAAVLRDSDQPRDVIGRVLDIGVGQQEEVRPEWGSLLNSLLHRPQLSRPSWGQRPAGDDADLPGARTMSGGAASGLGRAVTAVVVDDKNLQRVDTTLLQKRGDRFADVARFIAGGNDHGYADQARAIEDQSRIVLRCCKHNDCAVNPNGFLMEICAASNFPLTGTKRMT